jgi:hypothetical protein
MGGNFLKTPSVHFSSPFSVVGTFPLATNDVLGGPPLRSNHSFLALRNPPPPHQQNTILYRSISCSCPPCMMGQLNGCLNPGFVPQWQSQSIRFRPKPALVSIRRNAATVLGIIGRYRARKNDLPFYFCLARKANVQHPTVLLMTHLAVDDRSVRCHELIPHFPALNDFGHCRSRRPLQTCARLRNRCRCANQHAVDFPIENILEVAVYSVNGVLRNNFQRVPGQPEGADYSLVDLSSNIRNDVVFDKYARKRLQYFNDFRTLQSQNHI